MTTPVQYNIKMEDLLESTELLNSMDIYWKN